MAIPALSAGDLDVVMVMVVMAMIVIVMACGDGDGDGDVKSLHVTCTSSNRGARLCHGDVDGDGDSDGDGDVGGDSHGDDINIGDLARPAGSYTATPAWGSDDPLACFVESISEQSEIDITPKVPMTCTVPKCGSRKA
jgi:hypothetical protein